MDDLVSKTRLASGILPKRAVLQKCSRKSCLGSTLLYVTYNLEDFYSVLTSVFGL